MMNNCLFCYEPTDAEHDFHAQCSKTIFGTPVPPIFPYSAGQMTELAKQVVERSISVPGVQPKLSMSVLREKKGSPECRLTVVGALGGQYILKPPSDMFPEMPENEHLTMRIAESFGIRVVPSTLIRLTSGELAYVTRRIDRTEKGEKIHMLDMFQITEAVDKYKSSMERVGKALHSFSSNTMLDKLFFFELSLFCFITGNNDMHLKNFSMIESRSGWVLAPSYDLLNVAIVIPKDNEELALTLEGKKSNLKSNHFERFGKTLGLTNKQIKGAFDRLEVNKPQAIHWIQKSYLSKMMKGAYLDLLESRYAQLEKEDIIHSKLK